MGGGGDAGIRDPLGETPVHEFQMLTINCEQLSLNLQYLVLDWPTMVLLEEISVKTPSWFLQ